MDILNSLSPRRFREADDLLAFISIYDDDRRTRVYLKLIRSNKRQIRGSVCAEGGAGLGIFAAEMARLGARKVYAVEQNPLLARLARLRFQKLPRDLSRRIELVEGPLQGFCPPVPVHVLVHEFYGQLLYDEDLWVLDQLRFQPDFVLPDGGELRAGIVSSRAYRDRVITSDVVRGLRGVLVSGLFEERLRELRTPILRWKFGEGLQTMEHSFTKRKGDLLCLGLVVRHEDKDVCEAGRCPNWAYAWTPRLGNAVSLGFRRSRGGMECLFRWKDV